MRFKSIPLLRSLTTLFLLLHLASCASIVSDNESTVYFTTEPGEARCELAGQDFARVVYTPGSLTLPAEAAPIIVSCRIEGYHVTTKELDTTADGWIVGNLLFGGIIGAAIDASRGAGMEYPEDFNVVLDPMLFPTIAARDDWYDKRREKAEKKWDDLIEELKEMCAGETVVTDCDGKIKNLLGQKREEVDLLERRRLTSKIVGADKAAASPKT